MHALNSRRGGRRQKPKSKAKAADMPLADYQRLLLDARGYQILSYDDLGDSHHSFLERYVADGTADPLLML